MSRTALVTGAAGGIGRATALALIKAGYTVYGTSRDPEAATASLPGVRFFRLDLTDGPSVDALLKGLPPLDILICNAGASLMSAVEETPPDKVRALFELLVFGNLRLIQGVLPAMRQAGRGVIVNIGSYAEKTPVPCSAIYAGAKAALHVISNGLRQEVRPFGIKVVTVAPTFVRTPIVQERLCAEGSVYSGMIEKAGAVRDASIASGSPPEAVAKKIMKILRMRNPAAFYPVGKHSLLYALMQRILPERVREALIRGHFGL